MNHRVEYLKSYQEVLMNFIELCQQEWPGDEGVISSHNVSQFEMILPFMLSEVETKIKGEKLEHESRTALESRIDDKVWELAIAVNAAFKGLLGHMGESGQIAAKTLPISVELPVKNGLQELNSAIVSAVLPHIEDGDVVVIAEKPFPVAQGRLVPFSYIYDNDPKKLDKAGRAQLIDKIQELVDTPVEDTDLILADSYTTDPELGEMATVGAYNHNKIAADIAREIVARNNTKVDVIISDTDTGVDVRQTIIGCITITATPIGATKGLSIYECMRASCAAEYDRGAGKRIPIVICKPAYRCRKREHIGEFRGYAGKLDVAREGGKIAFA